MRVVIDTNVLVSALLKPQSKPAQILDLVIAGQLTLLLDNRILYEYREVLKRERFGFNEVWVDELMSFLDTVCEYVVAEPVKINLRDPDDLPFLEIAMTGKAEALITGNKKDFAKSPQEVPIYLPEEFLARYSRRGGL